MILNLSSYNILAVFLKDYMEKTSSHVLHSKHFLNMLWELTLDPENILVSFDVISLFTKVPIP